MHVAQGYVIIELNLDLCPGGKFIWGGRQRSQQWQLFVAEEFCAAAFFGSKRSVVILVKLLPDSLVECIKREELLIAECGNQPDRCTADRPFSNRLILWFADSGRDYCCIVMFGEFLIGMIDLLILVKAFVHDSS